MSPVLVCTSIGGGAYDKPPLGKLICRPAQNWIQDRTKGKGAIVIAVVGDGVVDDWT